MGTLTCDNSRRRGATAEAKPVYKNGSLYGDPAAEQALFVKSHPGPSTDQTTGACPGYVVDHIKPLACGGPGAPTNI